MDAPATRRFTPSLRHTKVLSRVFIVVSRSCASLMNVRYDLRAVVHIWPQYIHIFLSYSYPSWRIPSIHVVSYCGCIVIPLFTSIIEENTLKAPLKRLSDSRSSHIWITNVAGSPRTEVMLVKGCEGTLTMLRLYRCSDVSIQHGSIGVGKYRPINRTLSFNALSENHTTHSLVLSWARAMSLVMLQNASTVIETSYTTTKLNRKRCKSTL